MTLQNDSMEDQLQKISNGQSEEEKEMQEAKQKQEMEELQKEISSKFYRRKIIKRPVILFISVIFLHD